MSSAPLAISLVLVVILPAALVRAHARVAAEALADWARSHDLELTGETRPLVARYLRTARMLRTWGAAAGILLPSLVELAVKGRVQVMGFGTDGSSAPLAGPVWIFVGYLLGALCAEVSLARPVGSARRSASIVPRELDDYLPRRLLSAQRSLAVAALLGVFAIGLVPY